MFRLYIEYTRLISPDRDTGMMARITFACFAAIDSLAGFPSTY